MLFMPSTYTLGPASGTTVVNFTWTRTAPSQWDRVRRGLGQAGLVTLALSAECDKTFTPPEERVQIVTRPGLCVESIHEYASRPGEGSTMGIRSTVVSGTTMPVLDDGSDGWWVSYLNTRLASTN
jgi:hypothetical protein